MIYKYNKLVRDKIPEEIEKQGKKCKYEILDDEKYSKELDKKLLEEKLKEINDIVEENNKKKLGDINS